MRVLQNKIGKYIILLLPEMSDLMEKVELIYLLIFKTLPFKKDCLGTNAFG